MIIKLTKLQEVLRVKGIKQKELAHRLGRSSPAISLLAKKGIYDIRTATRYAAVLDVDPLFLLER